MSGCLEWVGVLRDHQKRYLYHAQDLRVSCNGDFLIVSAELPRVVREGGAVDCKLMSGQCIVKGANLALN